MICGECPVSPKLILPIFRTGCTNKECEACPSSSSKHIIDDIRAEDVAYGEPIIGYADPKAETVPMTSPRELTAKEWAEHMVTHLPYCSSCPYCIPGMRHNCPHKRSQTDRKLPHLLADYGYLKDSVSKDSVPFLVVYVQPFKVYFATVIDLKGRDLIIVKRLARLVRDIGLTHYTYRSDRKPAIRALLLAAALEAGIPDDRIEDLSEPIVECVAVPGGSHPGESASNGAAGRAIQMVEDQLRTMKLALEHRLEAKIPCHHPLIRWMIEHASMLVTNYRRSPEDNKTEYERLHGHTKMPA